jgi:SAM-dependent methyltransferase
VSVHADVIWHDLECGSYRADMPLWRELAVTCPGPILDLGAGTGRVTLDLAQAGHSVTALELEPILLAALRERAAGMNVETVCADARSFDLGDDRFGLCVVPMQTIQLLGGSAERVSALERVRAHLRPGGLAALAILDTIEPFDCSAGAIGPAPETAWVDGSLYISRPTRVAERSGSVLIEREREVLVGHPGPLDASTPEGRTGPGRTAMRDVIELDRVTQAELEAEATGVGLSPEPSRAVMPTEDHAGSLVVMLRA